MTGFKWVFVCLIRSLTRYTASYHHWEFFNFNVQKRGTLYTSRKTTHIYRLMMAIFIDKSEGMNVDIWKIFPSLWRFNILFVFLAAFIRVFGVVFMFVCCIFCTLFTAFISNQLCHIFAEWGFFQFLALGYFS